MVANGISTAALFMIAGALQHRLHTRNMLNMGGLWYYMPRMGACALFFAVASLGLPGLGNFVAEFLILLGLFAVSPLMAAIAAIGLITAAVYSLWMMQQTFQGKSQLSEQTCQALKDFDGREIFTMVTLMLALIWLGLYPQPLFDLTQPVIDSLQGLVNLNPAVAEVNL